MIAWSKQTDDMKEANISKEKWLNKHDCSGSLAVQLQAQARCRSVSIGQNHVSKIASGPYRPQCPVGPSALVSRSIPNPSSLTCSCTDGRPARVAYMAGAAAGKKPPFGGPGAARGAPLKVRGRLKITAATAGSLY